MQLNVPKGKLDNDAMKRRGLFIYLFIYIDTNNSGLKVPGHY